MAMMMVMMTRSTTRKLMMIVMLMVVLMMAAVLVRIYTGFSKWAQLSKQSSLDNHNHRDGWRHQNG